LIQVHIAQIISNNKCAYLATTISPGKCVLLMARANAPSYTEPLTLLSASTTEKHSDNNHTDQKPRPSPISQHSTNKTQESATTCLCHCFAMHTDNYSLGVLKSSCISATACIR